MSENNNNEIAKINEDHNEENSGFIKEHNHSVFYKDLDKIQEDAGYNIVVWKVMMFTILFGINEGFTQNFLTIIATAFRDYYGISNGFLGFISSSVYIGMAVGSYTTGILLSYMSRRNLLLFSVLVITVCYVIISLVHYVAVFIVFRFIGSICLGYYMSLIFPLLCEYLPVRFRGFVLTFIWFGFNLGAIYFLLWCYVYIPNLSYDPKDLKAEQNFNAASFTIFYPNMLNLILMYFFLKDSPRNLFVSGEKEQAAEILEYYVDRKLTTPEIDALHEQVTSTGENVYGEDDGSNYALLFSKRYLKLTVLFSLIFVLYNFIAYGTFIALPIIIKDLNKLGLQVEDNKTKGASTEIKSLIIYYAITVPSISAILSEFKFIGKRNIQMILCALCSLFAGLSIRFVEHFNILFFFSSTFSINAFHLLGTWANEVLPTKIRDTGMGFMNGNASIGAFVSQFVFLAIVDISWQFPVWFVLGASALIMIFLVFLPKNEMDSLDSELEMSDNSNNNSKNDIEKSK